MKGKPSIFDGLILPCTRKFITKQIQDLSTQLKDLNDFPAQGEKQRNYDNISVLTVDKEVTVIEIEKRRQWLKRKTFIPIGKEKIDLGNGVILKINGNEPIKFILDNIPLKNKKILSINSPLGSALVGKARKETGVYSCGKGTQKFEIIEILDYNEAKKILKE